MNAVILHCAWLSPTVWWRCTRVTPAPHWLWTSKQAKAPACQCCGPSGCCVSLSWCVLCLSCDGNSSSCSAQWTTLPYSFLSSYYLYSYLGKFLKFSQYLFHFFLLILSNLKILPNPQIVKLPDTNLKYHLQLYLECKWDVIC